jgi:nicotinamidase/pyrazinamidase
VPVLNAYIKRFRAAGLPVYASRDWHPAKTHHFKAFGGAWPPHCVQGEPGAAFHPDLDIPHAELIIRKGFHHTIDSYSAFRENDRKTPTGLAGYLRERGFERVTLCGLATDFCVFYSAIDAREAGFDVTVDLEASRAIDLDGSLSRALEAMREAGIGLR